jgi:uncharacterized Tic20 family protein
MNEQDNPSEKLLPSDGTPTKNECTWAMMAHLSAILAAILTGFFGGWIGPLIVWLVKREESRFVGEQAREALNFQVTLMIGYVIAWGVTLVTCGAAFPLLLGVLLFQIIFGIIASIKANSGQAYSYPCNIRLIN